ncbi:Dynein assembly factor 3, axonemal [Phlyctochytrium planicorne]|nr:Dynein assembly factor 3, axonemal [Phlyctochytrium planicorne]
MILLLILFDPESQLSVSEKAQYYFEVYGNMFLRPKVHELVSHYASMLSDVITGSKSTTNFFDFALNRFRDLDDLDEVARFIIAKKTPFEMQALWESRLRYHFGVRYDRREDVIDWDFHMILSKEPHHLVKGEYQQWRMTGQSVNTGESNNLVANKTWASRSKLKTEQASKWTFVGDIVTGPFSALGSWSDNEVFLKKENGQPKYTGMQIGYENLVAMLTAVKECSEQGKSPNLFKVHILPADVKLALAKLTKSGTRFNSILLGFNAAPYLAEALPLVESMGTLLLEEPP